MEFIMHSHLSNKHSFLSASRYHWVRYTEDKLVENYNKRNAAVMGTRLHNFSEECIKLKQYLPKKSLTVNMYVNDAIGFRMHPELVLYYSDNCFGTADAICFRDNLLRIHDLKTGYIEASPHQLEIYAAIFCLEYRQKPKNIDIELRVYQNDAITLWEPDRVVIKDLMERIIRFDKIINNIR